MLPGMTLGVQRATALATGAGAVPPIFHLQSQPYRQPCAWNSAQRVSSRWRHLRNQATLQCDNRRSVLRSPVCGVSPEKLE